MNQRTRIALAGTASLLCILPYSFWLFVLLPAQNYLLDFEVYRGAGLAYGAGAPLYGAGFTVNAPGGEIVLPYLYPPLLAQCMFWGALLFGGVWKSLWCVLNWGGVVVAALSLGIVLARGSLSSLPLMIRFLILFFLLICFEPLHHSFHYGQVNPLVLGLIATALAAFSSGRDVLAGVLLGVATGFKVTPGILFLAPLVLRRWRMILSGVGVLLVVGFLTPDAYRLEFLYAMTSGSEGFRLAQGEMFSNLSVDSLFPILSASGIGRVCYRIAILGIFGGLIRMAYPDPVRMFGSLVGAMVLLAPVVWIHHLVWLVIPLFLACFLSEARSRLRYYLGAGAFILLCEANLLARGSEGVSEGVHAFMRLLPTVILLAVCLCVAYQESEASTSSNGC